MFFAIPEFTTSSGKPVNATFWMAKFFMGQLRKESPDYLVFIRDAKGENFRHKIYSQYKATREKMPDNLRNQMKDIEEMIQKMNIQIVEKIWYEADDIIATLAVQLSEQTDNEIYILSWDKDLYALVSEQVKIYDTQKKKISGPEETFEKFGVPASCVRDYLAICGDSSDNIPGIAGIWPKKAIVLLNEFWSLEKIYEALDSLPGNISPEAQKIFSWKTLEKFQEGKEDAFLSQRLATLELWVDLWGFDIGDFIFHWSDIYTPEVQDFFTTLEFHSLLEKSQEKKNTWEDMWKKVQIITHSEDLRKLEKQILSSSQVVIDTETSSINPREAQLIWVSLLLDEQHIFYVNHQHNWEKVRMWDLQIFLKNILNSHVTIIWHNLKYDLQVIQSFISQNPSDTQEKLSGVFWQMTLEL